MATSTLKAKDGNEYEILPDSLGSGGQGSVRLGRKSIDGSLVAVKCVIDGASRSAGENRELQIALKIGQQPGRHLLAPLTWATSGADLLLVMPLADRSLAGELLDHPHGLGEERLLAVLRDVTTGLVELHHAGVVHRDLKPHNVLLRDGRWQLADFGMSRDVEVRTATHTFQYGGTALYWAPERWRGQPATHKSDLYALGCIAHELATGTQVFTGFDTATLQYQHLHTEPPPAPVGPALARWIMRLLDKDPARRHQDANAALVALPSTPSPPSALAAAALLVQQRRQHNAAVQGHKHTAAETREAKRTQALADLADICADAADQAQRELPDVRWDDHGDVHRFALDGIRLDVALWGQPDRWANREGLVLVGDVFTVAHIERSHAANVVCEDDHSRLHWYLDTFTRHPLLVDVVQPPTAFTEAEFFDNYEAFRRGGTHPWMRRRQPLTAETIINLLTDLLKEAARS